jgi:hypothetical protein
LEEESDASSMLSFSPIRSPPSLIFNDNDREGPGGVADEEEIRPSSIGDNLDALPDGETEVGRRLREMFSHKQDVECLQAK